MDQMDVDVPSISASSSLEKLDPAELDLDGLNDCMKERCRISTWQYRVRLAEGDTSMWQQLFVEVLKCLTRALAATDAIIATPSDDSADDIVKGFNKDEVEEWKAGVWRGVETDDWSGLITHRTYISDYWMVGLHLIATTAKIRKRKVPNIALGVPIEYSAVHFFPFHSAIVLKYRLSS